MIMYALHCDIFDSLREYDGESAPRPKHVRALGLKNLEEVHNRRHNELGMTIRPSY